MRKYFIDSVFLGPRLCFHLLETAGGLLFKVTRLRMETQWSSRVEVNRKVAPYVSDPVGGGDLDDVRRSPLPRCSTFRPAGFIFFAPENELTGSAAVAALSTSFLFHSLSVQWKASN